MEDLVDYKFDLLYKKLQLLVLVVDLNRSRSVEDGGTIFPSLSSMWLSPPITWPITLGAVGSFGPVRFCLFFGFPGVVIYVPVDR